MSIIVKLLVSLFLAALGTFFAYNSLILSRNKIKKASEEQIRHEKEADIRKSKRDKRLKMEYPLSEFSVNNSEYYLIYVDPSKDRVHLKILNGDTVYTAATYGDEIRIVIDSNYKKPVITNIDGEDIFNRIPTSLSSKAIIKYHKGSIETLAFESKKANIE